MFINTLVAIQNSTLLVVYMNENVVVYTAFQNILKALHCDNFCPEYFLWKTAGRC